MSDLKLNAVFTLIDKVTKPLGGINRILGGVGNTASAIGNKFGAANSKVGAVLTSLGKMTPRIVGISGALGALGGVLSIGSLASFGKGIFDVNAKFEQYEATLTTVLGSSEKAKSAMSWVGDFAARTPYDIDQVTAAFVKMNGAGMNAMDGTLENAGNWASGIGKSIDQVVEAFADARTGEFESLKELYVTSKTVGDKVTFSFSHMGKQMTKTVKKAPQEIQAALNEISQLNFAGAMLKQAKTAQGLISGISDYWTNFQLMVGNAGVFDHVKNKLADFLDSLNGLNGSKGKTEQWAKSLSDALTKLFDTVFEALKKIDWVKVINGLTDFVKWMGDAATKVNDFVNWAGGLENIVNIGIAAWLFATALGLNGVAAAMGLVSIAGAPVWLVVGAVAALAAIAFLVWQNWDGVSKWFGEFWGKWGGWISGVIALFNPLIGLAALIIWAWKPVAEFFGNLWNKISQVRGAQASGVPTAPPMATANVGGSNKFTGSVDVKLGPGLVPAGAKSSSKDFSVNAEGMGFQW